MSSKRLTRDEVTTLRGMLRSGTRYDEIAATFGVSKGTVHYHARQSGMRPIADQPGAAPAPAALVKVDDFHDQPFAAQALCAQTDPDAFFPEKGGSTREVKAVCVQCPVREECLTWAVDTDQRFGVWGGLSERERRRLKKQQPQQQLAATGTDTPAQPAPRRQYGETYIGGALGSIQHVPIPMEPRPKIHAPERPKPKTGIDWDELRRKNAERLAAEGKTLDDLAPAPVKVACRTCRATVPADELRNGVCDVCRYEVEQRFTGDTTRLGADLQELEVEDPAVAEASRSLDEVRRVQLGPNVWIVEPTKPPMEGKQGQPTTGSSAPGATSTSSTTGRAPVAGSSTPRGKNPEPARETRPTAGSGLLDVVEHCAQLLRDTATNRDPLVQSLRGAALSTLAALDLAAHPETPVAVSAPAPAGLPVRGDGDTVTGPKRTRRSSSTFNLTEARRLYLDEEKTCAQIATILGSTTSTVRKQLNAARVPMRDDRARGSGGWNKKTRDDDNPDLVAAVRRHYVDEQFTIERTAAAVGLSPKGFLSLMNRHGIERRPAANVAGQAPRWHKLDDQAVATICDRYLAGDSTVILAEAYGVSTPTITNALRRSGVQVRTPAQARRLALTRNQSGDTTA